MRFIFARHGESTTNTEKIISNRDAVHGLTGQGIMQAESLAKRLSRESVLGVFSSPLLRAQQTSRIIADALDIPLIIEKALKEFDCGDLEGRGDEAAWATFIDLFQAWLRGERRVFRMAGGENFEDISNRFMPFMQGLIQKSTGKDGSLLLVSHGGVLYTMLPLLLENISYEYAGGRAMTNTSIVIADEKDGRLYCREWCGEIVEPGA